MKRTLALAAIMLLVCSAAFAQRHTDRLDRGLVAVPTGSTVGGSNSNMVTWRRLADEYSGVTYNLYKDGSKVASNLTTTCFNDDDSAPISTSYRVAAVVNGVEQTPCDAVTPWLQYVYKLGDIRTPTGYIDIDLAPVYDRDGNNVTNHYEPNDAEMADLDGDGQLEIIIKRLNTYDASTEGGTKDLYAYDSKEFVVFDAYDVNWQTGAATLMWRIDCGPNMVSLNSTEVNIIAYDWDEDGKAEVVLRGADDMLILSSDGKTKKHTIGSAGVNKRDQLGSHTNSQYAWTHRGNEYLIYMNGETGMLYQQMAYPLKRFESNETVSSDGETAAWGDNYGHRSSKYFMGAPVLDGRKASLFLARGIYTRHKMMALDLDGHEWKERWSWNNNTSDSPWYGNGYHNFVIADVDEDGRDEIVYGSMVIDDNGRGLSTTGFGHGDAQHVGDFDPYRKGLEFFGCLEESPYWGSNYRNATTSEIYYKHTNPPGEGKSGDDGRCLMGNFSNNYPGSQGRSVGSGMIASPRNNTTIDAYSGDSFIAWGDLNFRIYWDGDLCDEILNSPGIASEAKVEKPGTGRLFTSSGCNMNNDSKNNPCFQGDIVGDWREEIVVRRGTGLRVYTSGMYTAYSMPCLWYDHEYRQAMVWQMMAYNQPPHVSYFVGEMEGFTQAPPPLTNSGRTEINDGGTISTTTDHLMMAKTGNMTVSVANGAAPRQLTVNTPSWVQGNDDNNGITTTYYTHTLTGGAFSGSMSLTKQGDGLLVMPNVTETYTGKTDVWAGSLAFSGTLSSSPVWMNRHTKLIGAPTISNALTMEYGAVFSPSEAGVTDATAASYATATVATLNMNEGARMVIQIDPANGRSDKVNIGTLNLRTRSGDAWTSYGPEYLKPVIQIVANSDLGTAKKYTLGTVDALNVNGTPVSASKETPVASVALEGAGEGELYFYGGKLVLFFDGADWEEETAYIGIAESYNMCGTNNGASQPVTQLYVHSQGGNYGEAQMKFILDSKFDHSRVKSAKLRLYTISKATGSNRQNDAVNVYFISGFNSNLDKKTATQQNASADGNAKTFSYGGNNTRSYGFSNPSLVASTTLAAFTASAITDIDITSYIAGLTTASPGDPVYIGIQAEDAKPTELQLAGYQHENASLLVIEYGSAVEMAIANCKAYETSPEFATAIDAESFSTAAEVYAFHSTWQIAKANASGSTDYSKAIMNRTFELHNTGGWAIYGDPATGGAYSDNNGVVEYGEGWSQYYTGWNGRNVSQYIATLPAGTYRLTAKVYSWSGGAPVRLFANGQLADAENGDDLDPVLDFTVTGSEPSIKIGIGGTGHEDNTDNTWGTWGYRVKNFTLTKTAVSVTLGANGYATFACPYALDLTKANLPSGVKAYKAQSINGTTVRFAEFNQTVPANTGILFEGTASATYNIPVVASGDAVSGNLFRVNEGNGYIDPSYNEGTTGVYYFAMIKDSNPLTFGKFNPASYKYPSNKAYLTVVKNLQQARLTVSFGEEDGFTGINAIEAAESEAGALKDGKYLIDGKIVLVKNGVKYGANGQKLN